ncbi:hypothetical protein [Variovorax rhizosphaerae]|uniref:Uncharacterized protein n=1 Tax=Variovorax rhizosphaerae TaxID=1836200 RepID=A0ABU8WWM0_9BURK
MPKPKPIEQPVPRKRGRQTLNETGEIMRIRGIRMTDSEWTDARFIGAQAIRNFVTRRARQLRKGEAT